MKLSSFLEESIQERIIFENPWWESGAIDEYYTLMYHRIYFQIFKPLVLDPQKRAIVLLGPRRVGKTIMLYHTIQALIEDGIEPTKICYLSMDNPMLARLDLKSLVERAKTYMKIDECQNCWFFLDGIRYIRNWELQLKELVKIYPCSKFVVAGSAVGIKEDHQSTSDIDIAEFILPVLSFHEYMEFKDFENVIEYESDGQQLEEIEILNKHFIDYINFGTLPEIIYYEHTLSEPEKYIRGEIMQKIILNDLSHIYGIKNTWDLNAFFAILAYYTGTETTLLELSQLSGLAESTITKYLKYLNAVQLVKLIYSVDIEANPQINDLHFKIYITNTALRTALFAPIQIGDKHLEEVIETAIFSQWQHTSYDPLFYYKMSNRHTTFVRLNNARKPRWVTLPTLLDHNVESEPILHELVTFCCKHQILFPLITTYNHAGSIYIDNSMITFEPASSYSYSIGRYIVESRMDLHNL